MDPNLPRILIIPWQWNCQKPTGLFLLKYILWHCGNMFIPFNRSWNGNWTKPMFTYDMLIFLLFNLNCFWTVVTFINRAREGALCLWWGRPIFPMLTHLSPSYSDNWFTFKGECRDTLSEEYKSHSCKKRNLICPVHGRLGGGAAVLDNCYSL